MFPICLYVSLVPIRYSGAAVWCQPGGSERSQDAWFADPVRFLAPRTRQVVGGVLLTLSLPLLFSSALSHRLRLRPRANSKVDAVHSPTGLWNYCSSSVLKVKTTPLLSRLRLGYSSVPSVRRFDSSRE